MQQIKGIWFPDGEHGNWIDKMQEEAGLPIYQPDALHALVKAAQRQYSVAIDGGAHVGLWTIHLARFFETVYAFEPNPTAFECLERNIEEKGLHDRVVVYKKALGRRAGELEIRGSDEKSLSWSARPRTEEEQEVLQARTVKQTSIDIEITCGVDAIKLDVEGMQYDALLGALQKLIVCEPVILLEEKHDDPKWRATKLLKRIGMHSHGRWKRDFLFTWKRPQPRVA